MTDPHRAAEEAVVKECGIPAEIIDGATFYVATPHAQRSITIEIRRLKNSAVRREEVIQKLEAEKKEWLEERKEYRDRLAQMGTLELEVQRLGGNPSAKYYHEDYVDEINEEKKKLEEVIQRVRQAREKIENRARTERSSIRGDALYVALSLLDQALQEKK